MTDRLTRYLNARSEGGIGWLPRYEKREFGDKASEAFAAGWYRGILEELIRELPEIEISAIIVRLTKRKIWETTS